MKVATKIRITDIGLKPTVENATPIKPTNTVAISRTVSSMPKSKELLGQ